MSSEFSFERHLIRCTNCTEIRVDRMVKFVSYDSYTCSYGLNVVVSYLVHQDARK